MDDVTAAMARLEGTLRDARDEPVECNCVRWDGDDFAGTLKPAVEGTGLSLFCAACGGWVEDSWLFSDGIPVEATMWVDADADGAPHVTFDVAPATVR